MRFCQRTLNWIKFVQDLPADTQMTVRLKFVKTLLKRIQNCSNKDISEFLTGDETAVLKKVKVIFQNMRPVTGLWGICLLNDAAVHKSKVIQIYLKELNVPQPYPLYSPDLSLSDFFPFPEWKKKIYLGDIRTKKLLGHTFFSISRIYLLKTTKKPLEIRYQCYKSVLGHKDITLKGWNKKK